ncbi:MAG: ATP-binding protein [Acidobacteria bacterium]|nr:ATP-binding protein [Acidobacteriota bacterium]MBI3473291.1 ATP-binding protein [Candidatus Solibacter usitatus]
MAETCPHCGGSGWKIVEVDGVSGAERCDCQLAERARKLEESSGIPPLYSHATFDTFRLPADNPTAHRGLAEAMLTVKTFARLFPGDNKPGLLLIGEPGTGKTHLAVAALHILLSKGFECIFFDYQNLLARIRSGYDAASNSTDREAYRFALDAEVLMLDDLGAHRVTDWVEDTVTAIITHRCNQRKPLIATTNLADPDAGDGIIERDSRLPEKVYAKLTLAERVGPRARSRLFEMCKVVRMPLVEDYRLRKAGRRA